MKELPYKYLKDTWVVVGMYNQADWTDLQNDANHRRKPAIQKESKAIETKENNKEKEDATLSHHLKRIIRQIFDLPNCQNLYKIRIVILPCLRFMSQFVCFV